MSIADPDLDRLLVALVLLVVFARGIGGLFARFGQPAAVGEIVGGLLLGPSALAAISPTVQHWIFPADGSSAAALGAIYNLGLLFLMFAAGTQMRRLLQRNAVRTVGWIASLGLVVPFAAGLGLVSLLGATRFEGSSPEHAAVTLVFGLAVAVTSIPVISRIMHDLGLLGTRFSRIVLSVAVIEDIVVYVVLAVAVGLVQSSGSSAFGLPTALHVRTVAQSSVYHTVVAVLFLAIGLAGGGRVYRRLADSRLGATSPIALQLVWVLTLSAAALALGIVPLYGAFVAGIAVANADESLAVRERDALSQVSFAFFIPIYFAIVGIKLDLIHHFDAPFFVGFLAFACLVKAGSVYVGALLAREDRSTAANLAIAMNARGGPGIVLATTAYGAGIIDETFFVTLVMLSVVTSLIAGAWLERVAVSLGGRGRRSATLQPLEGAAPEASLAG
jgi:Kef-type K+ transport system membrane component KefB